MGLQLGLSKGLTECFAPTRVRVKHSDSVHSLVPAGDSTLTAPRGRDGRHGYGA